MNFLMTFGLPWWIQAPWYGIGFIALAMANTRYEFLDKMQAPLERVFAAPLSYEEPARAVCADDDAADWIPPFRVILFCQWFSGCTNPRAADDPYCAEHIALLCGRAVSA